MLGFGVRFEGVCVVDEDVHPWSRTGVERMNRAFHVSEIVLREMQNLPGFDLSNDLDWLQSLVDDVLLLKNLPLVDLDYTDGEYIDMTASQRILA